MKLILLFSLYVFRLTAQPFTSFSIKPALLNLSQFQEIVIGEIVDENGFTSELSGILESEIIKNLNSKNSFLVHTKRSLTENYPDLNLEFKKLNASSLHDLSNVLFNPVIIFGKIIQNNIRQNHISNQITNCTYNCCKVNFYQLGGGITLEIYIVSAKSRFQYYHGIIKKEFNEKSKEVYCSNPQAFDLNFYNEIARRSILNEILKYLDEWTILMTVNFIEGKFSKKNMTIKNALKSLNNKKRDEAGEIFKYYATLDDQSKKNKAKALYNYGLFCLVRGNNSEALELFKKSNNLFPRQEEYKNAIRLAKIESERDDTVIQRRLVREIIMKKYELYQEERKRKAKEYLRIDSISQTEFAARQTDKVEKIIQINEEEKKNHIIYLKSENNNTNILHNENLPRIWSVIITVGDYQDKKIPDLNFTGADGQLINDFLKSPAGGMTDNNQIKHLSGNEATRANIIKALNETSRQAFDSDYILFFIACHGQVDSEGKEIFFLPYDAVYDNLEGTGVSEFEVLKIFNRSKAKKKILIADACHSGSLGSSIGTRASADEIASTNRLLRQIALTDESAAIFAASSASEKSIESPLLGHGIFTYFLVEGLKGKADKNKNGIVTLREAYDYTYRRVAEYTGGKQHPELKGKYIDSLPLSVLPK